MSTSRITYKFSFQWKYRELRRGVPLVWRAGSRSLWVFGHDAGDGHRGGDTYLLLNAPRISKMMSSNMVHEKAKVMEKTTWTTYCRTCWPRGHYHLTSDWVRGRVCLLRKRWALNRDTNILKETLIWTPSDIGPRALLFPWRLWL